MTRRDRSRQRWFLATATIFVATGGCTDSTVPIRPTAAPAAVASPGGGGGGGGGGGQRRLSIVAVNLSSSSLLIGGANVSYTVTVENKGSSVSDVTLQGAIVQGAVSHLAGGFAANCPPSPTGVVPKGSCQMTSTTNASNASGVGTLVPGPANFVLTMSLNAGGVSTVVDQTSVPVTLVAITRTITSLSLSKTTLVISDGTESQPDITNITAGLQNTGSALSNVRIQADFVQGTVVHNSGSVALNCVDPQGDGILPNGACTMNWFAVATNAVAAGSGTLVPGAATFVLKLIQDVNGTATVLDSKSVSVTLTGGTLRITNLALSSTTLSIGGAGVPYDVTIFNPGSQLSGVFIQGEMIQNGNVAGAGGSNLLCPPTSANGVLPAGTCTMSWIAVASNQSYAPAPLVPGAATFRLTLYQGSGSPVVLDTKSVPVTLVAGPPEVTGVIFFDPDNNVLLSATTGTDYNVTLVNSGSAMSGMTLKSTVVQTLNSVTSTRDVSDIPVACPSNASGTLPNGVCTFQVTAIVSNSASGSGPDLVPENDATYVVTLYQNGVQVATTSRVIHLKVQLF
ncbi:MAG: hypothetical protein ACJ79A_02900 [Gemmatimonadaceae bacterium]